ncbi:BMP family lipoprotein [Devriesea agamarum]|uniref:BMP family lipoprotein n=1 Tax=Devriesea agamarum TaxID=472569 RepID=UPI00071D314F|nr:BMP family ABC transporter substrate-binding protein [Devriesea agamarum]
MKNLTRTAAITGAMALLLGACGAPPSSSNSSSSGASDGSSAGKFKACMVSDSGGFDDKSFNESGKRGLDAAQKQLSIETQTAQSKSNSEFLPNINNLVGSKCDLVFTVGYLLATATGDAAKANPNVEFAIIDSTAQDKSGKSIALKNVKPIAFDTAQAAFLAGYLSAGMSKTGKVATYGGMKIPSVTVFMDGFADGVKKYNEVHGKDVHLLGWEKAKQDGSFVGSFEDQTKGKALTEGFYTQGADIVMPVAGPVGAGTLAAAKEAPGRMVVWVDADGVLTNPDATGVILTSVMKGISPAVEDVAKQAKDNKFDSKDYVGTLKNGGVDLSPYHDFDSKVPQELKDEVKQLKQDIIDGKIKVESVSSPKA